MLKDSSPGPVTATAAGAAGAADADEVAGRLRVSVTRLARLLRHQDESGLTPTLRASLVTIERHGPLTLGELAAHEQVTTPTITNVVTKLAASGLVARRVDDNDRRVCWVEVSAAGRGASSRSPRAAVPSGSRVACVADPGGARTPGRRARGARGAHDHPARTRGAMRKRFSAGVRATFQSFEIRNFRLFFGGQLISQIGNWLTLVAQTLLVLQPDRQRIRRRPAHRVPVRAGAVARRVGRARRRPFRQAPPADDRAEHRDGAVVRARVRSRSWTTRRSARSTSSRCRWRSRSRSTTRPGARSSSRWSRGPRPQRGEPEQRADDERPRHRARHSPAC